jgi:hypothetical protein
MRPLNPDTLTAIGVAMSGSPVEVPLYILKRVESCNIEGRRMYLVFDNPASFKYLATVLLQIVDLQKFLE